MADFEPLQTLVNAGKLEVSHSIESLVSLSSSNISSIV